MTTGTRPLEYRRLRAPQADRTVFAEPPLFAVRELVASNGQQQKLWNRDLQGRSLQDLLPLARRELLQAASGYTLAYRDVDLPASPEVYLLSGHQAELFHPGVWAKNFALAGLAEQMGGVGIHLIIDSDTIKHSALPVPSGSPDHPRTTLVPFDRYQGELPSEERHIVDRELWESFGERACQEIAPLVAEPILRELWPAARELANLNANVGEVLCQARHLLEAEWGVNTLEVPISRTCEFESFRWFLAHLLARLPCLHTIYNESLADYRRLHKLRSKTRPAPDLASEDGWLEAPFWIWTRENPVRQRLFVKQRGEELILSDRVHLEVTLPLTPEGEATAAVDALGKLAARGIKIRTRALTTTLWARLLLGDLFIHGIGGAKYDQLTDVIFSRFFELPPPGFLTLSATVRLPVEHESVADSDVRRIDCKLRDLAWNPDRHLPPRASSEVGDFDPSPSPYELAFRKQEWIERDGTRPREKFLAIREINHALQPWVEELRHDLQMQRDAAVQKARAHRILSSREYSFCLYPAPTLREFLLELAEPPRMR